MVNYPKIIKKLDINTRLSSIGYHLNRNGFITKGNKINDTEVCAIKSDETTTTISKEELITNQKEQIDYLAKYSKDPINENIKLNNFSLVLSSLMILTSVLVKVPIFGVCFVYFGGLALTDNINLGKLKKQIETDKWFSDNTEKVNEELNKKTKLYQNISSPSKKILTREGTITLNNIDEFPKNDLRLIRRSVSRKIKKEEKAKQKILTR